jgi:hypothetical protein
METDRRSASKRYEVLRGYSVGVLPLLVQCYMPMFLGLTSHLVC